MKTNHPLRWTLFVRFLSLILLLAGSSALHAHAVWIEPRDNGLIVRFAEPGRDFEQSPGHLDSLAPLTAFKMQTNAASPVAAAKTTDGFVLSSITASDMIGVETSFTVRGGRKPLFYARWQPANAGEAKPLLTLDIVPTGRQGEARVYFRGKPLAGIKAVLRASDGAEQTLVADADGYLRFAETKPGQYMLTVAHHREPLAGFHRGVAYQETSHNCSLVWNQ